MSKLALREFCGQPRNVCFALLGTDADVPSYEPVCCRVERIAGKADPFHLLPRKRKTVRACAKAAWSTRFLNSSLAAMGLAPLFGLLPESTRYTQSR